MDESIPKSKVTIEIFYDEDPEVQEQRRRNAIKQPSLCYGYYGDSERIVYGNRPPESVPAVRKALDIFKNFSLG